MSQTCFVIADEVSLASTDVLTALSRNLDILGVVVEDCSDKKVLTLDTAANSMRVAFPSVSIPESGVSHTADRKTKLSIKLTQFPISVADARTVHKLQG